ncbi:MAG: NADH-quinone oxidoreductase subunit NuoF [Elusimicrobiota bacterium]|jgi:NADH-quinone oxidoreductase subunit F|nr:NADH-quinone oxidoreductase subunit NuoF [Elusimicrobiota bacterium]
MQKADLEQIKEIYNKQYSNIRKKIIICAGTGCVSSGSMKIFEAFKRELSARNVNVCLTISEGCREIYLTKSGCQGFCQQGPLLSIGDTFYTKVKESDVAELVEKSVVNNEIVQRLIYKNPADGKTYAKAEDIPFYKKQTRFLLKDCGKINPEDINEYIANGGYGSAHNVFSNMTPEQVCKIMTDSGLRGRGGGGFPTGKKWDLTRQSQSGKKYVICNGDEGDPGAFMDRSVMEGNPHAVIEGMMHAARAIGADEGYVYVRMEYPLAVERMKTAVKQAEEKGILGKNIFDSGYDFKVNIMEGAGAFVCGEETALIASIEGERGMPRPKPPFPAASGLFGKPTVINNVETLANIAKIFRVGPQEYKKMGTPSSPGTKTYALTGHVCNTGLVEVPFGTSIRTIVNEIAGGTVNAKGEADLEAFKAVQIGGPSGGCLTKEHMDLPMDFDSLKSVGAMVGSGGLVVMNNTTCMVNIAKFFMNFTQNESCGKCVSCREGTKQMLSMLTDITEGRAELKTLELLENLANVVKVASLCGLGKSAPNPVLSTLKHFSEEYLAHIKEKTCPTNNCKALAKYAVNAEKCKGCTACKRACPAGAVIGEVKRAHTIDPKKCIKCGACMSVCKFNAISVGG